MSKFLGRTFTYDAENRQTSFNSTAATYSYDGEGRRVQKTDSSGTTVFVYDAMGRLLAEYADQELQGPGGTSYLTQDHLGSTRVMTDSSGAVIARHDYLPFGEEIPASWGSRNAVTRYGATDSTRQRFSGKERDAESGLDYFLARYYSGAQGRFTSPDEFKGGIVDAFSGQDIETNTALPYADITDPQTLNKYVYVRNNPLSFIDPDGHSSITFDGTKKEIVLYDKDGKELGRWKAANNVDFSRKIGKLVDSTYDFLDTTKPFKKSGKDNEADYTREWLDRPRGNLPARAFQRAG